MEALGRFYIAGTATTGEGSPFQASEATTGDFLDPVFHSSTGADLDRALARAAAASTAFGASDPKSRANLLDCIADRLAVLGEDLVERAMDETGLSRPRLIGELDRTAGQLKLFGKVLREGDYAGVRIDRGNRDRQPAAKPDLRLSMSALGPVAVFSASNFPLAFSVAGGDTASALAAGCPVIVKGHPAHPGTSEIAAAAVAKAIELCGFDEGIFSLILEDGFELGQALVADPRIKAVSFTGSRRAGLALMELAGRRQEPIPVFAEMSSINPVILMPSRLGNAVDEIAAQFVSSLTLGAGQFCTNPGLVIALEGTGLDRFERTAASLINGAEPATMLSGTILNSYKRGLANLSLLSNVNCSATAKSADRCGSPTLFRTDAETFVAAPVLQEEIVGPFSLIVSCRSFAEMKQVVSHLEGQLTIAIHFDEADHRELPGILSIAQIRAGRVLANGFGTGVEVSPAMVHGGPFPATSDGRSTSVGTLAISRFLRPVCLQDFPEALLPPLLQDANPWGVPRQVHS